jgi:hypothetical protein
VTGGNECRRANLHAGQVTGGNECRRANLHAGQVTGGKGAAVVLAMMLMLVARTAHAQQRIELSANLDADTVEVGDTLTYSLHVLVHGGGAPSDPKPGTISGFSLQGTSSMPVHMRTSTNGAVEDVNGLMTSWSLRADRPGTFSLGPAQITIGGTRRNGTPVRVKVFERGKGPPRRGGRPAIDPFAPSSLDPFKALFNLGDDDRRGEPVQPSADPKLAMETARAPVAFLHATIDKTRAVVGEQVTLSVYLYEDPYARQGRPGDVHEATGTDFVKRSLIEDETRAVGVGTAMVGGKIWNVKLVRKNALFPLKTGHLTIEPMSMTLPQARVGLRASETLAVDVSEPPVDGRPAGYAIGDVGDMSLQATVTPRATTRDGAIGITIELRGTGNLPGQLSLPIVPGVEWLEQQTRDKLGPMSADRFGGTRTFSYVVRLHKEGAVDLGEIKLPFYDAEKRTYGIARATLGIINVAAGGGRDAGAEEVEVVLGGMPKERRVLEAPRPETYLSERPAYWAALFGSPVACALALGAHGLLGRLREKRASASPSPDRIAKERRVEADAAVRGDDGKTAMGAIARAIETAVLAKTTVNLRGAPADTAHAELEAAGASPDDAEEILGIMRTCEDARFSPDGVAPEAARKVWEKARVVLDRLQQVKPA